jgi:sugar lactone lactonase YvrE
MVERIYAPTLQFPESIAVSPSGVVVLYEACAVDKGHNIVRVHEDGTLSTYGPVIDRCWRALAFDAASNLYAAEHSGVLYKIAPDQTATVFATDVAVGDLAVAPSGDIFAADFEIIQRITPEGQVLFYANNMSSTFDFDMDVHPGTGDLYVAAFDIHVGASSLYRILPDGTAEYITGGTMSQFIAFADDGTLYHNDEFSNLYIVSIEDGTLTPIPWVKRAFRGVGAGNPRNIDADSQGRIVTLEHGYGHVWRLDLETKAIEVLYRNIGLSTGLAVAPEGGGIYMTVPCPAPEGNGRVVRIEEDRSLTTVVDGLPPRADSLAFDLNGIGYIGAIELLGNEGWEWQTTIYTSAMSGDIGTLITFPDFVGQIEIDPTTGYLWGAEWNRLWYLDDSGERHFFPWPANISDDTRAKPEPSIAITPDGTVYARYSGPLGDIPVEQGLYRLDQTVPRYEFVADLSSVNLCCVGGWITAGSDGNIYWIGDGDRYTIDNEYAFHMLQITPSGEVTRIGYELSLDTYAITGDPDSTDIYFNAGEGVYRVFEADMVCLPLVLKGSD